MTREESKQLKVGTRVCFNGEKANHGTVTANQARYVTIKWNDGHESFTGNKEMRRVERDQGTQIKSMTGEQSRTLNVGDRVCWNTDENDHGTVTEKNWAGVTIKWNNRSEQSILHNDMTEVSSVSTK